jgi:aryl-alcohol dehydrogenase-like predicted oxidoreductase
LKYRVLGRTGLRVSILGFGGIPIRRVREPDAHAVVNRALDLGVNLVHTSVTYGDSAAKIGQVLSERRDECIVAAKVGGRTAHEAATRLQESLAALRTDHIELAELPVNAAAFPRVMGPGGAYEAFRRAQEEGLIDCIGITSHDVAFLAEAVTTDAFSNLVVPFNYAAIAARTALLPLAEARDLGVIAMKTLGKGGLPHPSEALRYVWHHAVDSAIVGMATQAEVEANVSAANASRALTPTETRRLAAIATEIVATNRLSSSGAVTPP